MRVLIYYIFIVLLSSCGQPQSSQDIAELKAKVLNLTCSNEIRRMYERKIEEQSQILTDFELRKSLENMMKDIKC